MAVMRAGLIGCGNIGEDVCLALAKGDIPATIATFTDIVPTKAEGLRRRYFPGADVCSLEECAGRVDYLVECASAGAVRSVLEEAITHHLACQIISIGGLLDCGDLLERAHAEYVLIHIPAGALAGLDALRAAREAGLDTVTLTTSKPPAGLMGAPYLEEKGIDLTGLTSPLVVFDGTAREACKAFPKNVNVAAALSLAGIGPDKTRIRVVADPATTTNIHEITAEGVFGRLTARTENMPSPRNPKSSYLASLSVAAKLREAAQAFSAAR